MHLLTRILFWALVNPYVMWSFRHCPPHIFAKEELVEVLGIKDENKGVNEAYYYKQFMKNNCRHACNALLSIGLLLFTWNYSGPDYVYFLITGTGLSAEIYTTILASKMFVLAGKLARTTDGNESPTQAIVREQLIDHNTNLEIMLVFVTSMDLFSCINERENVPLLISVVMFAAASVFQMAEQRSTRIVFSIGIEKEEGSVDL